MRYKTLFRVLLKVIGVWFVVQGVVGVLQATFQFLSWLDSSMPSTLWPIGWLAGHVIQIVLGLYCFFGGKWLTDLAIPGNRPYCPECGYDLSRSRGSTCPECGIHLPDNSVRH